NIQPPHSTLPIKDTIECYLADIHGKWLGSGVGNVFEMPVLYKQNECFKQSGTYTFQIIQGMRNEVLPGISNVGLKVEKISSPKKHN
ncbi:MAG TPA: gliding motility lipoprotein GldH, partial [Paludibacteraceae bacterium]|nr:gliding motility lipoprotein GldH [Paludibacteraceae bacterium]